MRLAYGSLALDVFAKSSTFTVPSSQNLGSQRSTLHCLVVVAAILSAIHVLTLAIGLGGVYVRGRALRQTLDEAGWRRLLTADSLWGLAAALWIVSGLGRVFLGGKDTSFYWRNGLFWSKLGLFGIVFVLELRPMMTFISVRSALRNGSPLPAFPLPQYQRINTAEIVLVVAIVFVATFMARGAWMF
jgi:putative membrane protein